MPNYTTHSIPSLLSRMARSCVVPVNRSITAFLLAMSICSSPTAMAAGPAGPNLLGNGDFFHGSEHWILQSDAPASAKEQVFETQSAPSGVRSRVLRVDIGAIGAHNWNIQLYQPGLDLTNDQPYSVAFWARADRERTTDLNVALDEPDWHAVGLTVTHVPLSRDWHRFRYSFTTTRATRGHTRLTFVLGDSPGTVEFAQISLINEAPGPPSGPNLLESADFVDNTKDWSLQFSEKANAKLDWQEAKTDTSDVSGKIARIDVTTPGEHNWNVQFQQSALDLLDRSPYTLTFWARADHERALGVSVSQDGQDWHTFGLDYQTQLTPTWRKYSILFTAVHTVKDHGRLSFLAGDAAGVVELAGVQLQQNLPAETTTPSQPSASAMARSLTGTWDNRSTDLLKRVRLTFNADGTGSVSTGAEKQEAVPTAPVSAYHWYLKEGGKRLVVGLRVFDWSIHSSGKDQVLKLTDRKGIAHLFYRQ